MRKVSHVLVSVGVTLVALGIIFVPTAAGTPVTISYQGVLSQTTGAPVPDSSYQVVFSIYDDLIAGDERWREVHPAVATNNGLFSIVLGSVNLLDHSVFGTYPLWLEIQIGADPPISPRTLFTSAPGAATAKQLIGSVQTQPGLMAIMPPDPIIPTDSLPHIQLIADSLFTGMKLHPPDPCDTLGGGANGGGMEAWVDVEMVALNLTAPDPCLGRDSAAAIKLTLDSSTAKLVMQRHTDSASVEISVDQNAMIQLLDPGGGSGGSSVKLSTGADEKGIIIVDTRPGPSGTDSTTVKLGFDPNEGGIIVVDSKPGDGGGSSVKLSTGADEKGIIIVDTRPGPSGTDSTTVKLGFDLNEGGIIVVDSKPGDGGSSSVKLSTGGGEKGIIVVDSKPGTGGGDSTAVSLSSDSSESKVTLFAGTPGQPADMVLLADNNGAKIGINTDAPTNVITVDRSSATDPIADAWTTYSSRRWKENIRPIQGALHRVTRLRGVSFDWKADGRHDIGLVAEEVGEVVPEVVAYEDNGTDAKSIDYARLVALLIEATKEQQKTIDNLKAELAEMRSLIQSSAAVSAGQTEARLVRSGSD